ncbi:hypothetical protein SSX86_001887 [Deinandra increscens subsp. villosa]|uniref:C2HC zinc finger plants domain-containing protein n=1 Tax=Deinandra increscens subsp. villosa TaxID=3103831 RepID=A0AAP0DSI7_9ASTR
MLIATKQQERRTRNAIPEIARSILDHFKRGSKSETQNPTQTFRRYAMDADMMDSDAPMTSPSPPAELSSVSGQIEVATRLLTLARQLLDQGKPSKALQAVVMAIKGTGGEVAAFEALNRAKEVYTKKIYESNAADELASLFAECAIAEALPSISLSTPESSSNLEPDGGTGTSILTESGRKQAMVDAFSDGTSFVCLGCGGLVSNNRKDEHFAFWCCNGDMR